MKKTLLLFLIGCFCFGLSSCDDEGYDTILEPINMDVNKIETIPVHIDKTDGDWSGFSFKNSLSIITPETQEYLNKIQRVEIKQLCYKITNFNGDALGEVQGTFQFDKDIRLDNSFVVKTVADDQTIYYVTDTEKLNRISEVLKNNKAINMVFSGSAICDEAPMDFIVEISFEAKVQIDPIYTDL
ncbi:MAG: hypothetical protein JSV73_12600 [Flavobacteriaceae bacterium]|nr:MAG: hypothetical protein JSV73_12600 [Flavobacteriaceae bacterium]